MYKQNRLSALQEIRAWNLDSVKQALIKNDLQDCCPAFEKHEIDGDDLLNLTEGKLALWKRELTLSSIRKVSKFVADLQTAPEKFLLQKNNHTSMKTPFRPMVTDKKPEPPMKTSFRPIVTDKKPEPHRPLVHPNNHHAGISRMQHSARQNSQSPDSEDYWASDFDDEPDDVVHPVSEAIVLPRAPIPSQLFGRPAKPVLPNRPPVAAKKPVANGGNHVAMPPSFPPPVLPARPPTLSRPPILNNITLPEIDDFNYYELEKEEEYSCIDEVTVPRFQPVLPPRAGLPNPVFNIPNPTPTIPFREFSKSPTPNIPSLHSRKLPPKPDPSTQIPHRDELFLRNLALLNKQSIPPYLTDSSKGPLLTRDEDEYVSEEYECIEDPQARRPPSDNQDDYLPPLKGNSSRPVTPLPTSASEMVYPSSRPPSPKMSTLPRKLSDASSTSSSGGSNVNRMCDKLRDALANRNQMSPAASLSELREKTPTPELQTKPPTPGQKWATSSTSQRPLPPTPDPNRLSAGKLPPPRQLRLTQMPWYHDVSRAVGEEMLRNGENGYFLMRPSSSDSSMTLMLCYNNSLYNIKVRHRPDQKFALGSEKTKELSFVSIEELVSFYQTEGLVLYKNGEKTGTQILTVTPPRQHH